MLDVQSRHKFILSGIWTGIAMVDDTSPDETDDPELAAGRIEAALERIARRMEHPIATELQVELAMRVDRLIERLRAALAQPAE
jgi:hypothetical protein